MNFETSLNQGLVKAVIGDEKTAVLDFLSTGACTGQRDENGMTILHFAAMRSSGEICQMLIDHKADVHAKDTRGNSPLSHAARTGNVQSCQALLSAGAAVNAVNEELETPLLMAAREGKYDVCDLLIKSGADPNLTCMEWFTPLLWICQDVPEEADSKMGKRSHAGRSRMLAAMELLVGAGALVIPNEKGINALHWVSSKKCDPAFLSVLLPAVRGNPVIDQQDSMGATPLFVAARLGHLSLCEMLLAAGANPLIEKNGVSPEEAAQDNGHEKIALTIKPHSDARRAVRDIESIIAKSKSSPRTRP